MLELAIAVARWLAEPKLKSRLTGLGGPPSPRLRIFDAKARYGATAAGTRPLSTKQIPCERSNATSHCPAPARAACSAMSDARCFASNAAPPSMTSPAMKIIAGAKIATNSAADPRSARRRSRRSLPISRSPGRCRPRTPTSA